MMDGAPVGDHARARLARTEARVRSLEAELSRCRRIKAELRQSKERLRTYLQSAPNGVFVSDAGGRIIEANPAGARMTGYAVEALLGMSIRDFVHPCEHASQTAALERLRETGQATADRRCVRANGSELWMHIECVTLPDGSWLSFCRDVTRERLLAEELRQSQKLEPVGRLAGGVAHDFNNQLTVIRACVDMMLEDLGPDHPMRTDLDEIASATQSAGRVTRQLLAFSRRQILEPTVLSVNDVIVNVTKMMRRLIGEDIDLVTHLAEDLDLCELDAGQLEQVVLNLAVNARDAMPHGGVFTLATNNVRVDEVEAARRPQMRAGSYVRVTISDDGMGMEEEVRERAFEPFFTTKPAGRGTGLGLSTVLGVVQQSGGHIHLDSHVGEGTTFVLLFPASHDEASARVAADEPQRSLAGHEAILLVEDHDPVRRLAVRILDRQGYRVLAARDGKEALALCASGAEFDLLLSDVIMPGASGPEVARSVARLRGEVPVLFMSGYTDAALAPTGVLADGVRLLQKPFTPASLAAAVRAALDGR